VRAHTIHTRRGSARECHARHEHEAWTHAVCDAKSLISLHIVSDVIAGPAMPGASRSAEALGLIAKASQVIFLS
jgi:hypothetical protein